MKTKQTRELDENQLKAIAAGDAQHLRDLGDNEPVFDLGDNADKVGPLRPTTRIFPE